MVDLYLLDLNHNVVDYLEGYESMVWTERFDEHGDAVLRFSLKHKRPSDFPKKWYLSLTGTDELMCIDQSEVKYEPDVGRHLEVSARSLTSLMERRIVWNRTVLDGNLESSIQTLLNQNIISPSVTNRKIDGFSFQSSGGSVPTVYVVDAELQGENLYSVISDMAKSYNVGFKVTNPSKGAFRFELIAGTDRSYNQTILPHVVFSPEFDNLANGRFFSSNRSYTNVTRVEAERKEVRYYETVTRAGSSVVGIHRFESYLKAKSEGDRNEQEEIPISQLRRQMVQQGREYQYENGMEIVFDGEADPTTSFGYGTDYFLGDIVQIDDGDIIQSPARLVEFIRSDDAADGYQEFPALRVDDDE